MSTPRHPPRTAAEWEQSFVAYNASSGLTQQGFCELHGLSHSGFRHRYRHSPLFLGKRRRAAAEMAASAMGGASVCRCPTPSRRARAGTPIVEPRMPDLTSCL